MSEPSLFRPTPDAEITAPTGAPSVLVVDDHPANLRGVRGFRDALDFACQAQAARG